jgi:hypothetical protein
LVDSLIQKIKYNKSSKILFKRSMRLMIEK